MGKIEKPVFWTIRAQNDLDKILRFYSVLYNLKKAKEIVNSIQQSTRVLENPNYDFSKMVLPMKIFHI